MTKIFIIKSVQICHKNLTKKTISAILQTVFNVLKENISTKDKLSYPGFGTFNITHRKARIGRNPKSGKKIFIKSSRTIKFKPSRSFKEKIQM